MKKYSSILALAILALFIINFALMPNGSAGEGMIQNLSGRLKWNLKMLGDPATGLIPNDMRAKELAFSQTLPSDGGLQKFATWQSIGPSNVGGRTRCVVIDKSNLEVLLAGAATGGIWRSTNGGISWYACNISSVPTANITSLVQDTRPGKLKNWYASSGELYGGNIPGAFYNGSGVYKSTDGGNTWVKAGNVASGLGGLSGPWSVIHRLAFNHTIDTADVLFAANFDGIFRSINAGLSWVKVRGGGSLVTTYSYFTDVAITPSGVVYATLSGGGQQQGFWRSADNGKTWANITPGNFQSSFDRISIGISPSDEKQVYFVANTPGFGKESKTFEGRSEFNSLWKYTYVSGDGSGVGGILEDRSANIPTLGGAFGDFISQGGYCLEINVKPDDANTVFLGGTNLYRSTDGFKTNNNTTWIGGYGNGTSLPDFKVYPNHHPDNHGVVFYPGNASKMISFHDGGISVTQNNLATSVSWESLNNGYLTSQFYTVALDHGSNSMLTVGGLQDNGTYLTASSIAANPWTQPLSYDGAYCFVKPGGGEVYLSIQQGRMQRMLLDANGIPNKFTRIDPKGVDKSVYQFINPFTPDANDFKVLYTPAGNVIWRNSDITAIPLKNQLDSNAINVNWTQLNNTLLSNAGDQISAMFSSKIQNDVLYYGTEKGRLYRLRSASDTASKPELINGANFPGGYIQCITQHPTDTGKIYAVFTNYNVLSIFESSNSGVSWVAISGNLEQNTSGAGNGPSCRWLTIAPTLDSLVYFVGTSTGLYATKKINGMQTVWTRQGANTIGSQIVTMMDHRTIDGRMVVSTYGSGVFGSFVQSLNPKTGFNKIKVDEIALYPNPTGYAIQLKGVPPDLILPYSIINLDGKEMLKGNLKGTEPIVVEELPNGNYFLIIKGKNQTFQFIKQ